MLGGLFLPILCTQKVLWIEGDMAPSHKSAKPKAVRWVHLGLFSKPCTGLVFFSFLCRLDVSPVHCLASSGRSLCAHGGHLTWTGWWDPFDLNRGTQKRAWFIEVHHIFFLLDFYTKCMQGALFGWNQRWSWLLSPWAPASGRVGREGFGKYRGNEHDE